jgi:hypothetical protein
MSKVNPSKIVWDKPQNNVDGTPIDYPLEYEVGLMDENGEIQPKMTVVGSLQKDNTYEAPIKDMGLEAGEHEMALRSFEKDNHLRKSVWSDTVNFTITKVLPEAPKNLAVS